MHRRTFWGDVNIRLTALYFAFDFALTGHIVPEWSGVIGRKIPRLFQSIDYRRVAELQHSFRLGTRQRNANGMNFESAHSQCLWADICPSAERDFIWHFCFKDFSNRQSGLICKIQPQWFDCKKRLLNIEGLGRDLYPDLDLWAKPPNRSWTNAWKKIGWAGPQLNPLQRRGTNLAEKTITNLASYFALTWLNRQQAGQLNMQLSSKI